MFTIFVSGAELGLTEELASQDFQVSVDEEELLDEVGKEKCLEYFGEKSEVEEDGSWISTQIAMEFLATHLTKYKLTEREFKEALCDYVDKHYIEGLI